MSTALEDAKAKASRTGLIASTLFLVAILLFSAPIFISDDLFTAVSIMLGFAAIVFGLLYLSTSLRHCLSYSELKKNSVSSDDSKKEAAAGDR